MLRIEKILCPIDFSEYSHKAFEYAHSLAQHYGAKLLLQHVVQPLASTYPYYAFPDVLNEVALNLESSADQKLSELVSDQQRDGLEIQRFVHKGTVPDCILAFAGSQGADLIVMGTHGRQGFDHFTMGSVTEKVLRKAHCPVLVVRKPAHDFVHPGDVTEPVQLKKLLFSTDFSEYSSRALTYALSLAMEYNAELTLLHVLEDVPATDGLQESVAEVTKRLEELAPSEAADWCSVRTAVRIGSPYQQVLQVAIETEADLVVMGVRGRNAVDLALFGSTTHRVIQLGACPVLAVHI
ncbi:MAG: universal stress protein [Acidobacteria bacterium]|nr:MAG: universal stress protein [Acidobacteriota bacterium]